ncbi:MAG: hypothetical protein JJU02_14255 [Cryomorphaceae bacterium]|nr:hypothetical protein [Cryomorphaceae bacterium]
MLQLIKHSFLAAIRRRFKRGEWGLKLLLGFLIMYFGVAFFLLGWLVLPELAKQNITDSVSAIDLSARFIIFYVVSDILMRFFFQPASSVELRHYVLLPISYRKLIHYMMGRSMFNFFNLLALLIILPFAYKLILPNHGALTTSFWLFGFLSILVGNTLISAYFKRLFAGNFRAAILMIVVVIGIFAVELIEGVSSLHISEKVFGFVFSGPLAIALLAFPVLGYLLQHRFLMQHRYAEQWQESGEDQRFWNLLEFSAKGKVSALVANEWNLMIRHKRTRTLLLFSSIFLFYGMIFYNRTTGEGSAMEIFVGIFITGFAAFNYGQFLGAWEGRYFDGIFSRNIFIEDFYRAKFRLLAGLMGFSYLLSLVYGFMEIRLIYLHTACFAFNLGLNSFLLLFFSTYQRKPLDLSAGSAFNYQGTSALQFLILIPLIILPIFIYIAVKMFFGMYAGYLAVGLVGLLSLALSRLWIKGVSDNFREKKYVMADGFRQKE